jgi:hypothetical protein
MYIDVSRMWSLSLRFAFIFLFWFNLLFSKNVSDRILESDVSWEVYKLLHTYIYDTNDASKQRKLKSHLRIVTQQE